MFSRHSGFLSKNMLVIGNTHTHTKCECAWPCIRLAACSRCTPPSPNSSWVGSSTPVTWEGIQKFLKMDRWIDGYLLLFLFNLEDFSSWIAQWTFVFLLTYVTAIPYNISGVIFKCGEKHFTSILCDISCHDFITYNNLGLINEMMLLSTFLHIPSGLHRCFGTEFCVRSPSWHNSFCCRTGDTGRVRASVLL